MVKLFDAVADLYWWLNVRWWGRLVIVATCPVWATLGLVIVLVSFGADAAWQGDIGNFVRWLWRGPNERRGS